LSEYLAFELPALIDMLAEHTANYTQMYANSTHKGEDGAKLRGKILLIQAAIKTKRDFEINKILTSSNDIKLDTD